MKLLVSAALLLAFFLTVVLVGSVVGFVTGKVLGLETNEGMTAGRVGALVGLVLGGFAHYGLGVRLPLAYVSLFDVVPASLVLVLAVGAAAGTVVQRLRR